MSQRFEAETEEELEACAEHLIAASTSTPIILLQGEMGVGKTTLVKRIIKGLGLEDANSPTFSLVNTYDTQRGAWHHFDLYRLQSEEELYDFGFEEYIDSGRPCLIEWPELAMDIIGLPYLKVSLSLSGTRRIIEVSRQD